MHAASPLEVYQQRLNERRSREAQLQRRHLLLGNARVVFAIFLFICVWLWVGPKAMPGAAVGLFLAGFVALGVYHTRIIRELRDTRRAVAVYSDGIDRIEGRWAGRRPDAQRFADPHHIYSADLDLFNRGGLFELLSVARTRMGEERLAHWLLAPDRADEVRDRQQAVAELAERIGFREHIALLGEEAQARMHPQPLITWAESPHRLPRWLQPTAFLMGALFIVACYVAYQGSIAMLVAVVIAEMALGMYVKADLEQMLEATEHAFEELELLADILAHVEGERFTAPRLQRLVAQLESHGTCGSEAIANLRTVANFGESRRNEFTRLLDLSIMYSVHTAAAAQRWRERHGATVRVWLDAIAELEALISLATYKYEHPADPFPEIVEGEARFEAAGLAHPLLPPGTAVANDVRIGGGVQAIIISGSNMSGKSTLMRAAGINTVLALAGAPVRAKSLRLSALQVGASIRINDSLQEGSSRFYAEIQRLRHLFDAGATGLPLFFLLDELLQGTNSHDRKVGATGVLRALLERGAIGMLSTHDLALTELAAVRPGAIVNMHFEDAIVDGKMRFDYQLRAGVVTRSNGIELMRSVGLDV